jgi:gamma-glutamylcyclotransferase (GGCT)/AIG2-like uncharacterized protein YtfP
MFANRHGVESPNLFVYGTLRSAADTKWSRFLASISRFAGPGRTRGLLFQLGGYPGMVVSAHDDAWVIGEVYSLNEPSSAWPVLDAYEGCGPADPPPHQFERQIVDVLLDNGQTISAWVYVYCLATGDKVRIRTGDYLRAKES